MTIDAAKNPVPMRIYTRTVEADERSDCRHRSECLVIFRKLPVLRDKPNAVRQKFYMYCGDCDAYDPITRREQLDEIMNQTRRE